MTPRSQGSKFHHLRTSCNLPARVFESLSIELLLIYNTYGATAFHKSIWRRARRLWSSRFICVGGGGGGGGQGIQCRVFLGINVVPVQLTIYSLSRLIRKMSDIYPSSHFVWHPAPPVPQLVQEYWCNFNAGTLPFPHGKETVSHCDRPWHFTLSAMTAWWLYQTLICPTSPLAHVPHRFQQISTCSLPRLNQPHCYVQDSFRFPPCWCCVHD